MLSFTYWSFLFSTLLLGSHATQTGAASTDSLVSVSQWDSTGWSGRVVVGEYLTGLFCPSCQPHEKAFDLLLRRYPITVFIPIAYHGAWNPPISTPADSVWERMYAWYGNEPLVKGLLPKERAWDDWIDGHAACPDSDRIWTSKDRYAGMSRVIDSALRTPPRARLRVRAIPKGGKLITTVTIDSLASAPSDLALRLLLIEDTVRLVIDPKGNPQHARPKTDHYMVVRSAARSARLPAGLPIAMTQGRGTVSYTFDVARAQKNLLHNRQLGLSAVPGLEDGSSPYFKGMSEESKQETREEFKQIVALFPDRRNWTIDPTRLHVVAFVQNMKTGDVLQAQMIPVKTGPHGNRLTL